MKATFSDYSTATLFVANKRAEGCFADVLHVHAGHLWGGPTTRYIVEYSDTAIGDATGSENTEINWRISSIFSILVYFAIKSIAVLSLIAAFIFILICVWRLTLAINHGDWQSLRQVAILALTVVACCSVTVMSLQVYRDKSHIMHRLVVLLFIMVAAISFLGLIFI